MVAWHNDFHTKRKKGESTIKNFRPVTLLNIIYKLWAIIITNRLAPYMNILTKETLTAYKTGRPTIDILSLAQSQIRNEETKQLILIDLAEAFDSINRNVLRVILYEKGLPWEFTKHIKWDIDDTNYARNINVLSAPNVATIKGFSRGSQLVTCFS